MAKIKNLYTKDVVQVKTYRDIFVEPVEWADVAGVGTPESKATNSKTFRQNSAPTQNYKEGDFWVDTDDSNHTYRASATLSWVSVRDGTIIAPGTGNWSSNVVFSSTDYDTAAWASGSLLSSNGTTYAISANNSGNIAAVTYIYLDTGASVTELQKSTTYSDVVGINKIHLSTITPSTDVNQYCKIQTFGGLGGRLFSGEDLIKNSLDSAQLLDNGDLENWTAGVAVAPDSWLLANGSVARSATHKIGTYSAALTRSGVDTALTEEFHADKGIAYWQGRTVTLSIWVQASDANVTIKIQDSVGRTDSSAHSGGGDWELLTVSRTIDSSATSAKAGGQILSTNQTAYFDAAMLVEGNYPIPFSPKYRDWGQAGNYNEIDGGNISVTSSISINDATWQNQGIQLQYNAGTPRLYVGDGANKYFQFDGTDASVGSDSLINTTPAGTIESRANSLFEDKAFIGNYNDGIPETTGGGSTITRDLVTTTLVGSFGAAGLLSAEFGLVYFADSFEIIMQAKEVATVETGRFGVSSEGTRHAYFWFDGGALKASSTDDDGNTATTITGITTTNWNTYRIVFDAGTSIKFYVNDILKATHDYTSAFDRWLKFYFMASEAAGDSTLYITNNYTIFADI